MGFTLGPGHIASGSLSVLARGSAMLHRSRDGRPPQSSLFETTTEAFPRVLMTILDPLGPPLLESFHLVAVGGSLPSRPSSTPSLPLYHSTTLPQVCVCVCVCVGGTLSHVSCTHARNQKSPPIRSVRQGLITAPSSRTPRSSVSLASSQDATLSPRQRPDRNGHDTSDNSHGLRLNP